MKRAIHSKEITLTLIEIILIGISLALDAFAVAITVGCNNTKTERCGPVKVAAHFGFFQFFMPVVGWYMGSELEKLVEYYDHWIAFGLLFMIGIRMSYNSLFGKGEVECGQVSEKYLLLLSLATSIDALILGFSFALIKVDIWFPAVIIGIVTALLSVVGVYFGRLLGLKFGRIMECIGGIILIVLGIKILFSHLQ